MRASNVPFLFINSHFGTLLHKPMSYYCAFQYKTMKWNTAIKRNLRSPPGGEGGDYRRGRQSVPLAAMWQERMHHGRYTLGHAQNWVYISIQSSISCFMCPQWRSSSNVHVMCMCTAKIQLSIVCATTVLKYNSIVRYFPVQHNTLLPLSTDIYISLCHLHSKGMDPVSSGRCLCRHDSSSTAVLHQTPASFRPSHKTNTFTLTFGQIT